MGYFSNGTSAEIFHDEHCCHCKHWTTDKDEPMCPVWIAHFIHNYDECNNDASILDELIPKDCSKCNMFIAANPERCRDTADMFEEKDDG